MCSWEPTVAFAVGGVDAGLDERLIPSCDRVDADGEEQLERGYPRQR